MIQNDFVPFIAYEKIIQPLGSAKSTKTCRFKNFMIQAICLKQDALKSSKISISPSVIFNPQKEDLQTILDDNQI